jgi:phytoene dehydrogenase-like protein
VIGFAQGLLTRTLRTLKFHPHELQAVRRGTPGLQVITNRHRIDLSSDRTELARELRREYPADADEILSVLDVCRASAESFAEALDAAVESAGQAGFLQSVGLARPAWNPPLPPDDVPSWGEYLENTTLSIEARTLLRAIVRPFCSLDVPEDLPLPVAGMHLWAALDGVYSDPGEEDPLLALLLRRVRAMRVDVQSEVLLELTGGRRKVDAAVFEGKPEDMPLQFVITGGDPEDLLDRLPGSPRAYERRLSRLAPSHFRYSIYLGVREEVVPPDLAEHVVLLDEDEDPEARGGSMLLSTSLPGSPLAPAGRRSITASTLLAYGEDGSIGDDIEAVSARMIERIKWLFPYLERHLEVLHVPQTVETSDDHPIGIDPRPAAYTPAIVPGDDPVAAGLGVAMPHRNVFCAGPAAFPALGLGGESLAGRLVERLALSGRPRPT